MEPRQRTNPPGAKNGDVDTSWTQVVHWPTWFLGSIGAFPYRDQPAPIEVYVLALLVLLTLLVAAVRHGAGVGRGAVVLAAVLSLAVPSVPVGISLQERGGMWQGRYSLPFTAGVIMLAGLVLDRVRWRSNPVTRPQAVALGDARGGPAISVAHVQLAELDRAVSADDAGWLHPPAAGTALLDARLGRLRSRGALAAAARPRGSRCGPGPRRGHARAESDGD